MTVPTSDLPARNGTQTTIDHIAVPGTWSVLAVGAIAVSERLSDHDVYWVEVERTVVPEQVLEDGQPVGDARDRASARGGDELRRCEAPPGPR